MKLWKPLETMARSEVEVWTAGYQIYIRRSELTHPPGASANIRQNCTSLRLSVCYRRGRSTLKTLACTLRSCTFDVPVKWSGCLCVRR